MNLFDGALYHSGPNSILAHWAFLHKHTRIILFRFNLFFCLRVTGLLIHHAVETRAKSGHLDSLSSHLHCMSAYLDSPRVLVLTV